MKPTSSNSFLVLIFAFSTFALSAFMVSANESRAVGQVLDKFHQAATKADGKVYFQSFSKNGIFIGTDATERWTVTEFKAFAKPYFDKGIGWEYVPHDRNIDMNGDESVAWFDELLDNTSYGLCRGSGVLVKEDGRWKLAQYHLTIPIPNSLAKTFVKMINDNQLLEK